MHFQLKDLERAQRRIACRRRIGVVVVAGLMALPLDASPIHLQCLIRDSYLTGDYGDKIPIVEKALCERLKQLLKSKALFLAWDYVISNGSKALPALVFTLSSDGQRRKITLQLERQDYPIDPWRRLWKEPGETLVDPLPQDAAEFFAERIDELILTTLEETIHKRLQGIPIATANWSPKGPPWVLTTLPWQGNEALRASKFRLACSNAADEFESRAVQPQNGLFSLMAMYRLSDNKDINSILSKVKELKLTWLYLYQFKYPDDVDVFSP